MPEAIWRWPRTALRVPTWKTCALKQQAAEKAIKAVMIKRNIEFPYVHDLGRLLELLKQAGEEVPPDIVRAAELTPYAVDTRYPGRQNQSTNSSTVMRSEIAETVVR